MADSVSESTERQGREPGTSGQPLLPQGDGRPRESGHSDTGAVRDAARFPVYSDIRDFHPVPGSCDIVTGGFPCQPFSQAGKRLGEDDPRNMWPHAVRVLVESGAPLGFFENVPGLLSSGYFGTVLGDLAEAGFDAEWCVLGADDVGAPHRRKRLWILAYRDGASAGVRPGAVGEEARTAGRDTAFDVPSGRGEVSGGSPWHIDPADVGHADAAGPQGHGRPVERAGECTAAEAGAEQGRGVCAGIAQSRLGFLAHGLASGLGGRVPRVAVGVPERVNRLRALGNGQVPLTMVAAWTLLADAAGILTWPVLELDSD